jgi:cytochrome c
MDSWEWNKIAGAVLGTLIFVLVIRFGTEAMFEVEKPAKEAYHVEGVVEGPAAAGPAAAPTEEAIPDFGTVLTTADATAGKAVSTKCEQCHDLSKGGPNKIGPNLWGLIGRPRASHEGFSYSSAMSGDHNPWTYELLFKFLKQPQAMVPGTKMSFAGLRSATDRINLLAYLRTQEDTPAPIPAPAPPAATPPAATTPPASTTPAATTPPAKPADAPK